MQDLFGKRYIALFGAMLLCIGCLVVGTAHKFGQAVAGMAIAGAGAGIGELTGLAGYVLFFTFLVPLGNDLMTIQIGGDGACQVPRILARCVDCICLPIHPLRDVLTAPEHALDMALGTLDLTHLQQRHGFGAPFHIFPAGPRPSRWFQ